MEVLGEFSKNHQNDDRKVFKKEWDLWIDQKDISAFIEQESKYLLNAGFEGDIMDKMFKSARYYFMKKSSLEKDLNDEEKKERKTYVGLSKLVLEHMDQHIKEHLGMRPEEAYNNYCNQYTQKIRDEIQSYSREWNEGMDSIYNKYKKTYKNRFYVMSKK
jgi:hypothetical protein